MINDNMQVKVLVFSAGYQVYKILFFNVILYPLHLKGNSRMTVDENIRILTWVSIYPRACWANRPSLR